MRRGLLQWAACAALVAATLTGAACRESGGISASHAPSGHAVSDAPGSTMGGLVFTMLRSHIRRTADDPAPQVAALERRRDELIDAVNAIFADGEAFSLKGLLEDVVALVEDGTLPSLTGDVASVLELLADDPDDPDDHRLEALARLLGEQPPVDSATAFRLASRLIAYPELEALLGAVAAVVAENDGLDQHGRPVAGERDLLGELLGVIARQLGGLERPAPGEAGTLLPERLVDALLAPVELRGASVGGPAWAVRLDRHGNPAVALGPDGRVEPPFIDQAGDGAADVDASGRPIDASGQPIEIAPFGQGGPRDTWGRALTDRGTPLFDYFDVKETPLGQTARMLGALIRSDVPADLVRGIDDLAGRVHRTDPATGQSFEVYADDSPLKDLVWGGLEVFRYRDAPKLLDAAAALIQSDPDRAERLLVKLVEAVEILRSTPPVTNDNGGASQGSMLDSMQPLLDRAFSINSSSGRSAARLVLETFTTEQRRLQNLPIGFARLMRYSDWDTLTPTGPGMPSMMEQVLDMMYEANQCDTWPFGNMAEFYLESMAGTKTILGISVTVNTIHVILDIPFLRSLLCGRIDENDVRALSAFAQSGALDALTPIARAFADAGEIETLKDIFLALHASYATDMRPYEPALIRILESGAVELLFDVLDDMNTLQVPGTGEPVSERIADFLEALVDGDRYVADRRGQRVPSLLHLLARPLAEIERRAGPELDRALSNAFDEVLATTWHGGRRVLQNQGMIPLSAAALQAASESMSIFPWIRNQDITRYQAQALELLGGRDLPVLVDVVRAVDRSAHRAAIHEAIANVLTPNLAAEHDIYGSVLEATAALLQSPADPAALTDVLRFVGRALEPERGLSRPIVHNALRLLDGRGGSTAVALLQNALDRGPNAAHPSPLERVLDVLADVDAAGPQASGPWTAASVREAVEDLAAFLRDEESDLASFWINIEKTR